MSQSNSRAAVYLVDVPHDWRPQRPWTFPPEFTGGRLASKNLALSDAMGYATAHNKAELAAIEHGGRRTNQWAIVARHLRRRPSTRTATRVAGGAK